MNKENKMKIYKTQREIEKDIKNGLLEIDGDVTFECSFSINASIKVNAGNINAWDITARNITAWNINAKDINAWNINAWDINAWDINAWDITARDISYYAFCVVYDSIKCISIKAKREKAQEPICLDGKLEFKQEIEEMTTIEIGGIKYPKEVVENALKDIKPL